MRYIGEEILPILSTPTTFNVVSGSSVGALNGVWNAGHSCSASATRRLSDLWTGLEVSKV